MMMLAKPCSAAGWDTGTSQNLFIRMALNDSWFATSRINLATRDGFGDKFFWYTDLSLGNRLSERWSGELGYRHAQLKLSSGWRIERRPLINVAWRDRIADWTVSNRHRIEFRFFDGDANDRVRYRNGCDLDLMFGFSGVLASRTDRASPKIVATDLGSASTNVDSIQSPHPCLSSASPIGTSAV